MGLLLSVISYQQLSPNLQATFKLEGASAVIGRSDSNDWVLPDCDKILSSRHAELTLVMGKYYITDVSTNGVFVNQSTKPLGKGNRHTLASGEQIILGEYVIEVNIEVELSDDHLLASNSTSSPFSSYDSSAYIEEDRVNHDKPVNLTSVSDPHLIGSELQDSLVLDSNIIPDDWNWANDGKSACAPKIAPKPVVDIQEAASTKKDEEVALVSKKIVSDSPQSKVKNTDKMAAFLKGLGIESSPVIDDEEWWFDLGTSIRTINDELMASLRDRALFKNQFRVNHTMFQIKENNPFKFSASVDDLFRNLYLRTNGSFMSTNKAITEAFGDLRQHEQSMRAGLEGAVVGVLEQLSPDNMVPDKDEKGFFDKFKRSSKELKMWRNFIEMHEDIRNEITVNRESILSDAFVRAYEERQKQGK
ncbi:type VI secretion system-associated FHA domain protein TagH [Moritella sp. 28]|uniref:type VI secretion system-associated FHA domain protein TagH n=1 Tax=Moritella sp. 28 TaxID=2746232 RepID=UPI001BACD5B4|nr:type VI secretion system-associated FHA domain protein TagH [Moritella sp. 28]QUM85235.1 type VI secretion system-associated FHA domain protein TagH [Moritella sp. 28]